jgi:hypothetical protein
MILVQLRLGRCFRNNADFTQVNSIIIETGDASQTFPYLYFMRKQKLYGYLKGGNSEIINVNTL